MRLIAPGVAFWNPWPLRTIPTQCDPRPRRRPPCRKGARSGSSVRSRGAVEKHCKRADVAETGGKHEDGVAVGSAEFGSAPASNIFPDHGDIPVGTSYR